MKPIHAIILIAPLLMAAKCQAPQVNIREACGVLRATLYQDGQFMLNGSEIDALTEKNQIKIVAVKNYYRANCVKSMG